MKQFENVRLLKGDKLMAKLIINTVKTIASLGERELRYTDINGIRKFDIRKWDGDKFEEGVRFEKSELDQLYKGIKSKALTFQIGNKTCVVDGDNYALSILHNGRLHVRTFASKAEINKLATILEAAKDNLLEYKETAVIPTINKPVVETKTETKKKAYSNAYEKFEDQFSEYRKGQPKNRQRGYELTHNIILEHIKDICKTSDEYNKNAMQEWKNTENMMRFCQDKAFENAEALMNINTSEEANELMFQWVDEYIGLDDKPKPSTKKSETKAKRGRPKKG